MSHRALCRGFGLKADVTAYNSSDDVGSTLDLLSPFWPPLLGREINTNPADCVLARDRLSNGPKDTPVLILISNKGG